ncbi:MAG: hypothetical protein MI724_18140 [Spirochaetales bacterium]|nr:hypothetical protein [Spirochaetales bacterium]
MKKKKHAYRERLKQLDHWDDLLLGESKRADGSINLELASAVADEGDASLFERLLSFDRKTAPEGSPEEFLAFCGVLGLGTMLAEGRPDLLPRLRIYAADERALIRNAVSLSLQRWGEHDMSALSREMVKWAEGSPWEQRAAVDTLCDRRLLGRANEVDKALAVLDRVTEALHEREQRMGGDFKALRGSLARCWSVAVAAHPTAGKKLMARWLTCNDPDVLWVMKENLKQPSLQEMDGDWVEAARLVLRTLRDQPVGR